MKIIRTRKLRPSERENSERTTIRSETPFASERVLPPRFQASIPKSWQAGGLLDGDSGRLDRRRDGRRLLPEFHLEIRGSFLVWKADLANRIIDGGKPPGVLRQFVAIESPDSVLKFAQRFG